MKHVVLHVMTPNYNVRLNTLGIVRRVIAYTREELAAFLQDVGMAREELIAAIEDDDGCFALSVTLVDFKSLLAKTADLV